MRTEQQLSDAFEQFAEQTPAAEPVLQRIVHRTSPSTRRRRRAMLVLAAAVVVALAVVLPTVLVDRTAEPADTRRPGNWNSVYRVDLEPGWRILSQEVTATSESAEVLAPMTTREYAGGCTIQVDAPGQPEPQVPLEQRAEIDVKGRPGFQTIQAQGDVEPGILYWRYQEDAWAQVGCDTTDAQNLEIARRMAFEPTPVRVPYRLRSLPEGYEVSSVGAGIDDETGQLASQVYIKAKDLTLPDMNLLVYPGPVPEVEPGSPGNWTGTVNGLPAVFDADSSMLSLSYQGHRILVEVQGGWSSDVPQSLRPQKSRELTADLASRMELGQDLTTPGDWPDANQALNP